MTRRDPMLRSIERHERQEAASTVTFRRPGTSTPVVATNEIGDVDYASTVVYTGAATVARRDTGGATLEYGEQPRTVYSYTVSGIPAGTALRKGDVGTVDTSVDATLVGKLLRVTDDSGSDWSASRTVECEAVA
jgi:hypothetical protein